MDTKLIVALDVKTFQEAKALVDELAPEVDVFKIGSILYTLEGKKLIEYIHSQNRAVFLDLKFFDIPNTVQEVSYVSAQLEVDMFTIHLLGGKEMIQGAVKGVMEACENYKLKKTPLILGVTVLTSMNDSILQNELKINQPVGKMVDHLADMGYSQGIRGFVCSPYEIELMRNKFGKDITLVTPGVRLSGEAAGDQKRVMTPKLAKDLGSDYIVMGRSVIGAKNKLDIVQTIKKELL